MKLFVFEGVLTGYSDGIAFALAKNPIDAKLKIYAKWLESYDVSYWNGGIKPKKWYISQYKKYLTKKISLQEWKKITGTRFGALAIEIADMEPEVVSKAEGFYIYGGG